MDQDLYDEFGNLIGDPLDSDAESFADGDEVQLPRNFEAQSDSDDNSESDEEMKDGDEHQIVLQEDKQYYASMSETFGPDVETVIQTQDTQDINEPIVKPLQRKTFQLQELNLPETTYDKEYMLEIAKLPERVRNVALTGDLHVGKTSFIDMLVFQTHPNLQFKGNSLRYTDSHKLENSKGLSLKTVPMTLLLPNVSGKSYVVNLLDAPGHVNFLDEVSVAQTTLDSTIIFIDAVQGLSKLDRLIIKNCLQKNIFMSFVINKIDRLILELRLPPLDSYLKLKSTLDEINSFIQSNIDNAIYTYKSEISPEFGNVCFASSLYQFCFTLKSFVSTLYKLQKDADTLAQRLWGDIYYEKGVFTSIPQDKTESSQNRSFVKFVLDPLYKIFHNVLTKSEDELPIFLQKHFKLKLDKKIFKLDPKSLLINIFHQIFGASIGFVDMLETTPSPLETLDKTFKEFESMITSESEIGQFVLKCENEAPTIAHITKLIDTVDSKRFYGLVKVVSGCLKLSTNYQILGENFNDDDEDLLVDEKFSKLYIPGGRYKMGVESINAGNIGLIMSNNLDNFITKSGTIYDQNVSFSKKIFKPLDYMIHSVFKVAVEPKNPSELHKLLEGFRRINRSYVGSEIKVEESGEHVVLGSGELYLDCLLHDLRYLYTDIEIKVSDPLTKFSETCVATSMINMPIKSANGLNKVSIIIEPLESQILLDIENEVVSMLLLPPRKLAKWFREKYEWDSLASRSIWSFGSSHNYPNILIDDTLPDEVDKLKLTILKNFIIQGFQWATREGPLCEEPIRNLKFKIIKFEIADDMIDCNGGQIIPMIRNACYAAMLLATPRLMELIYSLNIVVKLSLDQDSQFLIDGISNMLAKRRGHVLNSSPIPATQLYRINGQVPVLDSVGLETDIRLRTQGQAMCFMSFDKWAVVPGDPLDKHLFLPPLKPVPYKSLARDCMLKTRRRKGLNGDPSLTKYVELELLQELKDSGIIDDE